MVTHQRLRPIFILFLCFGAAGAICRGAALAEDAGATHSNVAGSSVGPDVFIWNLPGTASWGSNTVDNVPYAGFSVGTDSCNAGDANIFWYPNSDDHPVIRTNLYRLHNNRFEQIGTSWVKHGFYATNQNGCSQDCVPIAPGGGYELAPDCSDLYSASLNGDRSMIGPSSDVNAFTGVFPWPRSVEPPNISTNYIGYRLQARHSDLSSANYPNAKFFVDGHYVTRDDAAAGNGDNNASHRAARVLTQGPGCIQPYCLSIDNTQPTQQMMPAIYAWQNADPTVQITEQHVPAEGLFILATRVQDLGTGFWRYEYALYNMNSHRSAASFSVPLPEDAIVQNVGFHDVHHNDNPWDRTDWPGIIEAERIVWAVPTPPEPTLPENANALRWSTLYNFRFDVNAPPTAPGDSHVDVGLFRPGQPPGISIRCQGPSVTFIDCNQNGIADLCDVSCDPPGCDLVPCGLIADCNNNGVPDSPLCEADCNDNGIPDECDIADCPIGELACGDCNNNTVPDECDDDCDGDGEPDTCELTLDTDEDGFEDCQDLCPYNTPPNGCSLPEMVTCLLDSGFCVEISPQNCEAFAGTPMCGEPPENRCEFGYPCPNSVCRDGCLVGDSDLDGDRDFFDFRAFQGCFSSSSGGPAYAEPPTDCLTRFDVENDGDVDWTDYQRFQSVLENP